MSQRLTALTTPCNSRWKDIEVVAEGSEVAGYSVTPSDFAKARRIKVAIEKIYGAPIEDFIKAYTNSKSAVMTFMKLEDVSYKQFVTADNNQTFLKAILKRSYKLAEGMTSRAYLLTKEISRHLSYDRKNRHRAD